jgi:hypothetical protein
MVNINNLADKLQDTQEFCTEIDKFIDNTLIIEGYTVQQWKRHFFVKIPEEINFMSLVDVAAEIAKKYQQASYYRDKRHFSLAIIEQTKAEKFHEHFQFTRREHEKQHGKPLAAESCKVAANLAVKDIEASIVNQKVIHDFWTKTCNVLTETRKLIELMIRALSSDAYIQKDLVIKGEH